jgi:xylulokinase
MAEPLRCVSADRVITGWDFSTGSVKCLAFDLDGNTLAQVRLDTDLWTPPHRATLSYRTVDGESALAADFLVASGVSELNVLQLEGQARASTRAIADLLGEMGRLDRWVAGGISATHHTAGRIDRHRVPVRRAICWNDHTLPRYHRRGLERLGGQERVRELIGGPWASRYTLSHLLKDEEQLKEVDWKRTWRILPHGALAAGFLTGNFEVVSVSAAASTGIMDLRTNTWCRAMLDALEQEEHRTLAWEQLPAIVDHNQPIGQLSESLALEVGLDSQRPLIFPTSDDQQAGLVGGGAVDSGQMAVILGNSAVVNVSSDRLLPASSELDAMRLNWGPYLWMRCYNNGAQFLDPLVGANPDWAALEQLGQACPPGGTEWGVLPFSAPEPSLGILEPRVRWYPREPTDPGRRFRTGLEALAYLIKRGVREHEQAGQTISQIIVSGGIARSNLMCKILATVLGRKIHRLVSDEGPALGAAVTALASLENDLRHQQGITTPYTVADAVAQLVRFRDPVEPTEAETATYQQGYEAFERVVSGEW